MGRAARDTAQRGQRRARGVGRIFRRPWTRTDPPSCGSSSPTPGTAWQRMISPAELSGLLPPGPLRSALDSALWDLLAKRSGARAWELLGMPPPRPVPAIRTVPLVAPDAGGRTEGRRGLRLPQAEARRGRRRRRHHPAHGRAPSEADAWLMTDADGTWDVDRLHTMLPILQAHDVRLLEQPLPQAQSGALATLRRPFPIITDLAYGTGGDLGRLGAHYGRDQPQTRRRRRPDGGPGHPGTGRPAGPCGAARVSPGDRPVPARPRCTPHRAPTMWVCPGGCAPLGTALPVREDWTGWKGRAGRSSRPPLLCGDRRLGGVLRLWGWARAGRCATGRFRWRTGLENRGRPVSSAPGGCPGSPGSARSTGCAAHRSAAASGPGRRSARRTWTVRAPPCGC